MSGVVRVDGLGAIHIRMMNLETLLENGVQVDEMCGVFPGIVTDSGDVFGQNLKHFGAIGIFAAVRAEEEWREGDDPGFREFGACACQQPFVDRGKAFGRQKGLFGLAKELIEVVYPDFDDQCLWTMQKCILVPAAAEIIHRIPADSAVDDVEIALRLAENEQVPDQFHVTLTQWRMGWITAVAVGNAVADEKQCGGVCCRLWHGRISVRGGVCCA